MRSEGVKAATGRPHTRKKLSSIEFHDSSLLRSLCGDPADCKSVCYRKAFHHVNGIPTWLRDPFLKRLTSMDFVTAGHELSSVLKLLDAISAGGCVSGNHVEKGGKFNIGVGLRRWLGACNSAASTNT